MIAERSPAVKKAVVELKRLSQSEEAQRLYEAREVARRDEHSRMRTSYNKGTLDGAMKEKVEIAKNLIKIGLSNEQISTGTGLLIAQIETLRS